MYRLLYVAAGLVAVSCIGSGDHLYLVYVGAVVYAIRDWRPVWVRWRDPGVRPYV